MISTIAKHLNVFLITGALALGISLQARADQAKPAAAAKSAAKAATNAAPKADASKPTSAAGNGKLTVMEFNAVWCAPCKAFAPVYERVKTTFAGQADFQSWDADSPQGEKLANKYKVSSLPTVVILNEKGKVVFKHGGIMDEKSLTAEMNKALGK